MSLFGSALIMVTALSLASFLPLMFELSSACAVLNSYYLSGSLISSSAAASTAALQNLPTGYPDFVSMQEGISVTGSRAYVVAEAADGAHAITLRKP